VEDITESNITIEEASSVRETFPAEIRVAPNPATDHILIGGSREISRVALFSIHGVLVRTVDVAGTGTSVDVSDLTQGAYTLVLIGPSLHASTTVQVIR
jgi:hypothetical protein